MPSNGLIVFNHIVHTGGKTFCKLLSQYYWDAFFAESAFNSIALSTDEMLHKYETKSVVNCVLGHHIVPFGGKEFWTRHDRVQHVTILRDPVDRHVSHRAYDAERIERELEDPDASFNYQTAYVSGSFGPAPRRIELEQAKENLRRYAVVGVMERYDEFVELFTKTMGLPHVGWQQARKAVGEKKPISESLRERVRERLSLDEELYEVAKEVFCEQLDAAKSTPPIEPTLSDRLWMRLRYVDRCRGLAQRAVLRRVMRASHARKYVERGRSSDDPLDSPVEAWRRACAGMSVAMESEAVLRQLR
jgi:hypothetical protein